MDQYLALSKRDLQINISLNEVYGTHSLLMQHVDTLARNEKSHLRIILDELGPAPAQVPRKENRTIDLALFSRWEIPIHDITTALMAENVRGGIAGQANCAEPDATRYPLRRDQVDLRSARSLHPAPRRQAPAQPAGDCPARLDGQGCHARPQGPEVRQSARG